MEKKKILIAEDDIDLLTLYQTRFSMESWDVVTVEDGSKILEAVKKNRPDLILLDIMLPGETGLDALEEIRNDPEVSYTPVIVFSALANESLRKKAMELGALSYHVKSQIVLENFIKEIKERLGIK